MGPAGLTAELLRFAATAVAYTCSRNVDCNVYANGPYLAIHAAQDGPIELDTGAPGPVRDLLSGQVVGEGPRLTLPVKSGDTRILVTHPH